MSLLCCSSPQLWQGLRFLTRNERTINRHFSPQHHNNTNVRSQWGQCFFDCSSGMYSCFFHVRSSFQWWRWGLWPAYPSILLLNPTCSTDIGGLIKKKMGSKSACLSAVCMPRCVRWTARQRQNGSMISAQGFILSSHFFFHFWPRQRDYY